jgi:hypothetical protein
MKDDMTDSPTPQDLETLSERALSTLAEAWVDVNGYTAPNTEVYPWMWLWDSCFHMLIWGASGSRRATSELRSIFEPQNADGCVPHMGYQLDPPSARELWRQDGRSFLTQPPMFGHSIAVLTRWGYDVESAIEPARRGMRFLLDRRRNSMGLVNVVHPWEARTDDSPRWGAWAPSPFDRKAWGVRKRELLRTVVHSVAGSGLENPSFTVAPAGFNALVAFNLRELCGVTGDESFRQAAADIIGALEGQWDDDAKTWVDWSAQDNPSSRVRTLEALLGVLVTDSEERTQHVFRTLFEETAFGARYGPAGVHREEPSFRPDEYWRGSSWPQLTYLFFVAALARGADDVALRIRNAAVRTAIFSGFAEYVNPLNGQGLGAVPQGWAGLPLVMQRMLDER